MYLLASLYVNWMEDCFYISKNSAFDGIHKCKIIPVLVNILCSFFVRLRFPSEFLQFKKYLYFFSSMRWSMLCCLWHRTTRLVAFGNKLCLKNTSFALGWTALCLLITMGQSKIYSLVSLKGILDKSPDDQKQCQSGKIAIHSWWWPYTIWWTIYISFINIAIMKKCIESI